MKQIVMAFIATVALAFAAHGASWDTPTTGTIADNFTGSLIADGQLDEWGVPWITGASPAQKNRAHSDWIPTTAGSNYWVEDGTYRGYVGPGRGGQNFDIEAGYMGWSQAALNLAIVTGTNSTGQRYGSRVIYSGDIFFDINGDDEWDFAVATRSRGRKNRIEAGHVYGAKSANWTRAPLEHPESAPAIMRRKQVEEWFEASYIYSDATALGKANDHNVIEVLISLEDLAGYLTIGDTVTVHFTQTCGNDVLRLTAAAPEEEEEEQEEVIPEPMTLGLIGLGLAGMAALRKRRR